MILAPKVGDKQYCECMATVHNLYTNCLKCGKIICEFEASGKCIFCSSSLVGSTEVDSKSQAQLERLLEFEKQTGRITDFQSDFDIGNNEFNKWFSKSEREQVAQNIRMQKEFNADQKRNRVITLDLENKKVLVEQPKNFEVVEVIEETNMEGLLRNPNLIRPVVEFIARHEVKSISKPETCKQYDPRRLQDANYIVK